MRTRNAFGAKILWLFAASVLAASAHAAGASAQSGRTPAPPTPTPSPTATAEPAPKLVAAPDEEKYRLIHTPGWDGPLRPAADEADMVRHSRMNSFVARLNEAGARGYRLLSVVNGQMPVGVVMRGEVPYEYGWFEASVVVRSEADVLRVYTRFFNMYRKQAAGGFRLADHFVTRRECGVFSTGFFRVEQRCLYRDLYLLERRKGDERPVPGHVAAVNPDTRPGRRGDELTARIKEGLAEGLRPAHALSRLAVLLEEPWAALAATDGAADYRVVTQTDDGRDFERDINELARQGYRMHLNNYGVAVMRRATADAAPAEYLWLDASEKGFARRLAEAQEAGAVYRMTAQDDERAETRLVFERTLAGAGRRRDYRMFRVELLYAENAAERKVVVGVSQQTRADVVEIGRLLNEGYVVRDLFWAGAPHVLLERAP